MKQNIDLSRFVEAHKHSYKTALEEIKNGHKYSHWMWYIFPQIQGLGKSSTSRYYAIKNSGEALAFLNDAYLGGHLIEMSKSLMQLDSDNPTEIFGKPDDMKLRSCMTLFASVSDDNSIFHQVINKYFDGKPDKRTLAILQMK